MTKLKNPVQMAVIGAAHGIKGEVRVKSFTADPLALGGYGPLFDKDGRRFEIAAIRPQGDMVVARFKGVDDRTAAEALTGLELHVDRSTLPEPDEDDEFYQADLAGLEARDAGGAVLGRVKAVQNFGGGDILVVAGRGRELLVPFTMAAVPEVSIRGGYLTVDPVAAGLVDDGDGERTDEVPS